MRPTGQAMAADSGRWVPLGTTLLVLVGVAGLGVGSAFGVQDLLSSSHPCFLPHAILLAAAAAGESQSEFTGRLAYLGNPCTTEPCLPGMAFAVMVESTPYYLTSEGAWLDDTRAWDGYTPAPGDKVTVIGRVIERRDVRGDPFLELEVASLRREE